jgi:hypothetical protein
VYALDFFLLHFVLAGRPPDFVPVLKRMAEYLDALLGMPRAIPPIGDDDGGRLFHPYGTHLEYGRASVATASVLLDEKQWHYSYEDLYPQAVWWLGAESLPHFGECVGTSEYQPKSRVFHSSGLVEMGHAEVQVFFDAGPFGAGTGGHSHSDTLSLIVRRGGEDILIDAGAYTYVGDPQWRNRFRSSAFHNTIRVDGRDQGEPSGPFGWRTKPKVTLFRFDTNVAEDIAVAECTYGDVELRRSVLFLKRKQLLFIVDEVKAPGENTVEQLWHFADEQQTRRVSIGSGAVRENLSGWRSRALLQKEQTAVVRASTRSMGETTIGACIDCSELPAAAELSMEHGPRGWLLRYNGVTVTLRSETGSEAR